MRDNRLGWGEDVWGSDNDREGLLKSRGIWGGDRKENGGGVIGGGGW